MALRVSSLTPGVTDRTTAVRVSPLVVSTIAWSPGWTLRASAAVTDASTWILAGSEIRKSSVSGATKAPRLAVMAVTRPLIGLMTAT